MTVRALVLAVLATLALPHEASITAQEARVWVERTIIVKVTAEKAEERVRVRGALYGVGGRVQIVDQRTPIEWMATTTTLNGILQADDEERIRVELMDAGRKGGSSGFGNSVVFARGLPAGGFLMFPGSAQRRQRQITLRIQLPNGASPVVIAEEGGFATADFPELGTFGFRPTFRDQSRAVVDVAISEGADPNGRILVTATVAVGDAPIQTTTSPPFGVAVTQIE